MVEFGGLHVHQQMALRAWRKNYLSGESQQVGLWVWGDRRAGSSTIADIALSQAVKGDGLSWEYATNIGLMDAVREQWNARDISRNLPHDYDLYVEANRAEMFMGDVWEKDILLLDDLHSTPTVAAQIDFPFWLKHCWPRIEQRVKQRKATIIATNMQYSAAPLADIKVIIKDLFVRCHAER